MAAVCGDIWNDPEVYGTRKYENAGDMRALFAAFDKGREVSTDYGIQEVTDEDLDAIEEMWSAVDADLELGELDAEAAWLEHIAELHADDVEVDECQSGQCDWRWA